MTGPLPAVRRESTGLDLVVRTMPGLPVCAVRAFLRGGSRTERLPGTSCLVGRMLAEGTARRTWSQLSDELDDHGMSLFTYGGTGAHGLALDAMAGDWERAVELVADLLLEPTFPEERRSWLTAQTLGELGSLADQPEVVAGWAFRRQLYQPHPLQWPLQGHPESLGQIDADACRRFHRAGLAARLGVVVTGAVEEERVSSRLEGLLGERDRAPRDAAAPAAPLGGPARLEVAVPGAGQAHLFAGRLTVDRASDDLPALELLGVILGASDGLHGRLPGRIREQDGNAYVVGVQTAAGAGVDPGHLSIYVGTSEESIPAVEQALKEELAAVLQDGVTDVELAEARAYLLGLDAFRRETTRQWADLLIEELFYGQPYSSRQWFEERWRDVDAIAATEVARRHLAPDDLKITVGYPAKVGSSASP